ncbi:hypothetical protein, partial [Microcoleus sp. LEGE 07076]|uniref:hypothetical protein n=1 Tax=Microcoleus sp. LEGE 07076 TaxID=915322 RepID=UPI001D13705F
RSPADLADIVPEFILMWRREFVRPIYLPAPAKQAQTINDKVQSKISNLKCKSKHGISSHR